MVVSFRQRLMKHDPESCAFASLQTLQINLGNVCNLRCSHCHVNATAAGDHLMSVTVMDKIIRYLAGTEGVILDLTGGCPELHPQFRYLVERTAGCTSRRILRSNLAVMTEPGMTWLAQFCRDQDLIIIGSLPCYLEENVDRQRGRGTYEASISALKELNRLGYGSTYELNLVYNPGGAFLPGAQEEMERAYRKELADRHGISFSHLYCITNAPLGRFREYLERRGEFDGYVQRLSSSFNPATVRHIMCRTLISVDWRGVLYHCDFNQAAGLPITDPAGRSLTIDDLEVNSLNGTNLVFAEHCYCCTAGAGSSCKGSFI